MALITKTQLNLAIQSIKKLLSFKADKTELAFKADKTELETKVDRSEIEEEYAVRIVAEMGFVSPVITEDGAIYTDENGVLYSL